MPNFTKTKMYSVAAAFAVIIPTITYFNIPVPKLAWSYEVKDLDERQLNTAVDLYQRELSRQRYENLKLQREQKQALQQEGTIPDSYLKEQEYLESDIKDIEKKIKEAHERLLKIQPK